jgi:hexulose-6-phosphate isomerase
MQGRLCDEVDGKIQAFPWKEWESEFSSAREIGMGLMEWTLDQARLYQNPLMTADGQKHILALSEKYRLKIVSLTGDCFMQAPFWKTTEIEVKNHLKGDFLAICNACSAIGIEYVVIPLVDAGAFETKTQEDEFVEFCIKNISTFEQLNTKVIFESDYSAVELARFIQRLPHKIFGINYDIGNSAALAYDPKEEFSAYGDRILNVHVKDRVLGGRTVALGSGNANFEEVFSQLKKLKYSGNYILQTARPSDGDHKSAIKVYKNMVQEWLDTKH